MKLFWCRLRTLHDHTISWTPCKLNAASWLESYKRKFPSLSTCRMHPPLSSTPSWGQEAVQLSEAPLYLRQQQLSRLFNFYARFHISMFHFRSILGLLCIFPTLQAHITYVKRVHPAFKFSNWASFHARAYSHCKTVQNFKSSIICLLRVLQYIIMSVALKSNFK